MTPNGKPCKRGHIAKRYTDGHCIECRSVENKAKYVNNPDKMRARAKQWRVKNHEKAKAIDKKWAATHPEKIKAKSLRVNHRESKLKYKYGITLLEFDAMLIRQGNVCAICREYKSGYWHVDHNHETGKVRGILCRACNLLLGFAKDNPNITHAATRYLSRCANIGEPVRRHEVIPIENPVAPTHEPHVPLPVKQPVKPDLEPAK